MKTFSQSTLPDPLPFPIISYHFRYYLILAIFTSSEANPPRRQLDLLVFIIIIIAADPAASPVPCCTPTSPCPHIPPPPVTTISTVCHARVISSDLDLCVDRCTSLSNPIHLTTAPLTRIERAGVSRTLSHAPGPDRHVTPGVPLRARFLPVPTHSLAPLMGQRKTGAPSCASLGLPEI